MNFQAFFISKIYASIEMEEGNVKLGFITDAQFTETPAGGWPFLLSLSNTIGNIHYVGCCFFC